MRLLLLPVVWAAARVIEALDALRRPRPVHRVPPHPAQVQAANVTRDPLDLEDLEMPDMDIPEFFPPVGTSTFQKQMATPETQEALKALMPEETWRAMESAARLSHAGAEIRAQSYRREAGYGGCDG